MSDIESMSSDCSDGDLFTEEFLENIPDDSDLSDNEKSRDRHPKGRLPENTRFKRPLETSNDSNKITNGRTQNKRSCCNNKGHNHATCPSNHCQKKKKNDEYKL
ncbi:unnamed protein product [Rhizophagus irregularis]|nr:unnamed protein product [Rhizophagus irregularis]CAB5387204.1 unnamed protein product [Rhizophagus irregularis]